MKPALPVLHRCILPLSSASHIFACAYAYVHGTGLPCLEDGNQPASPLLRVGCEACWLACLQLWRMLHPRHTPLLYDCFRRELAPSFHLDADSAARFPNLALAREHMMECIQVGAASAGWYDMRPRQSLLMTCLGFGRFTTHTAMLARLAPQLHPNSMRVQASLLVDEFTMPVGFWSER